MMKNTAIIFFVSAMLTVPAWLQAQPDTSAIIKNNRQLYSIVVSQNDKIIYNRYFNGKSNQDIFNNQSLTKSVVALLVGIAIDKGFIGSVDDKLVKYFPVLKQDADKRKQAITIREVMNQASGLWHENLADLDGYFKIPDPSGYVLKAPLVSVPGKTFHYNNAASHLLSVLITKSTGMGTLQFAQKYLFNPLGITNVKWGKMRDGYYDGCGLLSVQMSTVDMNKIGSLVLHNGYFNNKRIVPQKWIAQIRHPDVVYDTGWGFKGSIYGLCWYHNNYNGHPILYGLGWGGQYVFVIDDKHAVITVNESTENATAIKAADLLLNKIFPIIYGQLK